MVWLIGLGGIALGGQRLRASRNVVQAQNAQLARQNLQLQQAYEQLDREFKTVGDVQVSLLPPRIPEIPGFQVATHYKPARRAGGDYFDFFPLPDNRWGFLVADVSGHGAPAAVVMAMTRVILHTSRRWTPPDEVLAQLNDDLSSNILLGQFVTACYGVLDPTSGTFTFASAGHPQPLYFEPEHGCVEELATESGFPLGLQTGAEYPAASVTLAPESLLVLYTDGITEALDAADQQFGPERLMNVLQARHREGAAALRDAVLASLDAHRGPVQLADDATLVVISVLRRNYSRGENRIP